MISFAHQTINVTPFWVRVFYCRWVYAVEHRIVHLFSELMIFVTSLGRRSLGLVARQTPSHHLVLSSSKQLSVFPTFIRCLLILPLQASSLTKHPEKVGSLHFLDSSGTHSHPAGQDSSSAWGLQTIKLAHSSFKTAFGSRHLPSHHEHPLFKQLFLDLEWTGHDSTALGQTPEFSRSTSLGRRSLGWDDKQTPSHHFVLWRSRHLCFVGVSKFIRCLLIFPSHASKFSLDVVVGLVAVVVVVVDWGKFVVVVVVVIVEVFVVVVASVVIEVVLESPVWVDVVVFAVVEIWMSSQSKPRKVKLQLQCSNLKLQGI